MATQKHYKKKDSKKRTIVFIDSVKTASQLKGIDFIASGNLPRNWNIEIDFDNECYFKTEDELTIKAKPNAHYISDPLKEIYTANAGNDHLEITIYKEKCNDKQSNTSITTVNYNGVTYDGCGQFLFDKRLQQTWVLDYIDNDQQFPINYPNGIPFFKIDLIKKRLTGFDGFNKLTTNIDVKGNRILFGQLNKAPLTSIQSAALINEFISNHLVDYFFREEKLVFQLANDTRLSFRLKDN
jgi:uncharacterized membrane protein